MVDEADRRWVDSMPEAYARWLAPTVFHPFAVELSARVARRRADRILELAAGTGAMTGELVAAASGRVLATDLNAAMVTFGRARVPAASWLQADAGALPFAPAAFDAVACQFGVMFFPDRPSCYLQARRVLAPGGTLVFNTWAALASHTFQEALVTALEALFPDDPPTFMSAIPHGYADPDRIMDDVRAGGFDQVSVQAVTLDGHATTVADLAAGYCAGTPLRPALERRGDLASATASVAAELGRLLGTGPVTGSMTAYVVEAELAG
jgi:SAM-dependent methyltransferase